MGRTFKYFSPYRIHFQSKYSRFFALDRTHLFLKNSHSVYYPKSQLILPCTPNPEKCKLYLNTSI